MTSWVRGSGPRGLPAMRPMAQAVVAEPRARGLWSLAAYWVAGTTCALAVRGYQVARRDRVSGYRRGAEAVNVWPYAPCAWPTTAVAPAQAQPVAATAPSWASRAMSNGTRSRPRSTPAPPVGAATPPLSTPTSRTHDCASACRTKDGPGLITPPTITGTPSVGQTLTCSPRNLEQQPDQLPVMDNAGRLRAPGCLYGVAASSPGSCVGAIASTCSWATCTCGLSVSPSDADAVSATSCTTFASASGMC